MEGGEAERPLPRERNGGTTRDRKTREVAGESRAGQPLNEADNDRGNFTLPGAIFLRRLSAASLPPPLPRPDSARFQITH